jgi:MAGE homology domain
MRIALYAHECKRPMKVTDVSGHKAIKAIKGNKGNTIRVSADALIAAASERLRDIYGYDIVAMPHIPKIGEEFKGTKSTKQYLIRNIAPQNDLRMINLLDTAGQAERGFIMIILALIAVSEGQQIYHCM